MRAGIAVIICVLVLLSGCGSAGKPIDNALLLRNKLLESDGCSFRADITVDYGEEVHVFTMDCKTDKEGNLSFTVISPTTISGIKGNVTDHSGSLIFDDQVLAFPTIADGQVTPVTAPWLFMKTLRSGYIHASTDSDAGYSVVIDDSYQDNALRLLITVSAENLPVSGEIFWDGRRILTVNVEEFKIL